MMLVTCFLFIATFSDLFTSAQLSSGSGVVGLGRTLFEPTCCYSCLSSLWSLELSCSKLGKDVFSINSPACHASNSPYLTSLAYCIQQKCALDGISTSEIQECWNKVAGDGSLVTSYESNLPNQPPTNELSYDASSLDKTMLVNDAYYSDSRSTLIAYAGQETNHALYSTVLLTVAVGFCAILGLALLKDLFAPRFQLLPRPIYTGLSRFIFLPGLFGKRHSRKLPYSLGYIPPRRDSLIIILYVTLNVVFCAISYPLSSQDTWYVGSSNQQQGYIGNRLGVLSVANIALTVMFSGRNTILLYITGTSRAELITFHRWSGRIATLEGLIHGAIYLSSTNQKGTNFFTSAAALHFLGSTSLYWEMGVISLVALVFIFAFSVLPIRTRWYEAFVLLHIALVIIALVTLRYHLSLRFKCEYGFEVWLYIVFCIWIFDRFIRVCRLLWANWTITSNRAPVAEIELLPGNDFIKVTVHPSRSWSVAPGQYCYIHFPTIPLFLESHPFSIASWSDRSDLDNSNTQTRYSRSGSRSGRQLDIDLQDLGSRGVASRRDSAHRKPSAPSGNRPEIASISFIIRPASGLTRRIHSRLLEQGHALSIPVLIEGPYGSLSPAIKDADTILAFAGGIGITAVLGYLKMYMNSFSNSTDDYEALKRQGMRAQRLNLAWAVRESSLVEAINSQLPDEALLRGRNVEIAISCRQRSDVRMDCRQVLRRELRATTRHQKMAVLVCGPSRMADEIRSLVIGIRGFDHASVQLVEESFAW